ncbi:MAG: hypothetical protein KA174_05105 [Chitinophagales bacterium]|jgi:hypothetical protein|nr:hypothetical protein [Chitinophagales bacterium]
MKKLESLNNEKFAALQSSEIGNLAAVVGGVEKATSHGTCIDITYGELDCDGSKDIACD